MIVKEVEESIKIKKLEALLRYLSLQHPRRKEVEDEFARSKAGHRGEKSLDYHLELLPQNCLIFHDLRLPHGTQFFQIDILIISPYFLLIIEVKNISGTLIFDQEFNQLIRLQNGIEETFPSPISQVYRQKHLFLEWMKEHNLPSLPVESLVVISNPLTRIKAIPEKNNLFKSVIHSNHLLAKFHAFTKTHRVEKLSKKELKKLSKLLLKHHTSTSTDILQNFNIEVTQLLKGVACPNCGELSMIRNTKKWYCPRCSHFSTDAHIQTLKDFALLICPTITNSQCCDFLQISSRYVAKYLLKSMNFPSVGVGRYKKYLLEFDEKESTVKKSR